ncbi:hypothetical protein [Chlamydiifrater volucris]|uniref:hypothetical protein n=1 Tax=Chlamydiifrater volucris TaxID=2681470 RepID=UPI001BCB7DA5|nr:hypothetical protein [Chlamydiifrater volucris]
MVIGWLAFPCRGSSAVPKELRDTGISETSYRVMKMGKHIKYVSLAVLSTVLVLSACCAVFMDFSLSNVIFLGIMGFITAVILICSQSRAFLKSRRMEKELLGVGVISLKLQELGDLLEPGSFWE